MHSVIREQIVERKTEKKTIYIYIHAIYIYIYIHAHKSPTVLMSLVKIKAAISKDTI